MVGLHCKARACGLHGPCLQGLMLDQGCPGFFCRPWERFCHSDPLYLQCRRWPCNPANVFCRQVTNWLDPKQAASLQTEVHRALLHQAMFTWRLRFTAAWPQSLRQSLR